MRILLPFCCGVKRGLSGVTVGVLGVVLTRFHPGGTFGLPYASYGELPKTRKFVRPIGLAHIFPLFGF